MKSSTKKIVIFGGIAAAGVAFWYFFFGPGAATTTSTGAPSSSGATAPPTANEKWWLATLTPADLARMAAYWPQLSAADRQNLDWVIQNIWMVTPEPTLPGSYQVWFNGFTDETGIYKND